MTSRLLSQLRTEVITAYRRVARMRPRRSLAAALVLAQLALSGCQTPDSSTLRDVTVSNDARSSSATVVGRLELYQNGARIDMGLFSAVESAGFVAAPHGSDRGVWLETKSDGSFRWKLEAGEYDVVALRLQKGSGFSVIPIDGRLAVTRGAVVDVGTLLAETDRFGGRVRRIESPDSAANAAADRTGQLQVRSRPVGRFSAVVDVCAARWWLQCSSNIKGVTALNPPVTIELGGPRAARVTGLQPGFSWQGSVGAAYDFAVWRAVEYRVSVLMNKEHVRGPLVHYAEGLDKAEFTDIPPLQPRSRYYWSVRLRQGDTVSTWSTAGHFTFLLVAMSRSSGRPFEFETP